MQECCVCFNNYIGKYLELCNECAPRFNGVHPARRVSLEQVKTVFHCKCGKTWNKNCSFWPGIDGFHGTYHLNKPLINDPIENRRIMADQGNLVKIEPSERKHELTILS